MGWRVMEVEVSEKLLPCPFCESDDVGRGPTMQSTLYFVECYNCECSSAHFIADNEHYTHISAWEAAVDSWNTRQQSAAEAMRQIAIQAYQAGYGRGHNDTVEGAYCGSCEDDDECALEWLAELDRSLPIADVEHGES